MKLFPFWFFFRYSMGVKTVHIDQIDEAKMQAHVRVGVANSEKIDCDTNMFSLIHCKDVNMEGIEILTNNTEKDENQSGLRKRNVKVEDGKETSKEEHIEEVDKINGDSAENENEDNSVIEKKKLFDPIKWFGVLVPVSLKQSQIEFKKSVELVVNIGNLQTKLESLRENYWELLHLKKTEFSENER